jgi:LysM domain
MESGGNSNNLNGREGRTPPDEEQIRIARARLARGFDLSDQARPVDGSSGSGGLPGAQAADNGSFQMGANRSVLPGVATADSPEAGSHGRPWADQVAGGAGPIRCEFLRSISPDGRLSEAQRTAVPTHRCAAFGDPLPLSLRQQELVCLQRVHVSCPRYVRGTLLASEGQAQAQSEQKHRGRLAVLPLVGVLLVIVAVGVLVSAFLGLGPLGGGGPKVPAVAAASPTRSVVASNSGLATLTAAPSPLRSDAPSAPPSPRATPAATPTAAPTPTPLPTSSWPPGATASRMSLLTPCTGQANCYLYTVRGPGPAPSGNGSPVADTLDGIATYFGVSVASIEQMNPWLNGGTNLEPGDQLKIPPPTR